tara:strand:+ start:7777 stop:8199 length:423 start_codon:yes stop_codon:yes gene_type:complete
MKKSDLKKILKPLIKECLHEVLLTEGLLSNIIMEVSKGLSHNTPIIEQKQPVQKTKTRRVDNNKAEKAAREKLNETRKMLLDAVNKDAYNGINVFEGTTPVSSTDPSKPQSSLAGVAPKDPGVDISGIVDLGGKNWSKLI